MSVKFLSVRRITRASTRATYLIMVFTIPGKPRKIRVIFECSAKFSGVSLNSMLFKGTDLTNSLVGVLTSFQDKIVVMADIESMFYQVRVPDRDSTFLRFLCWDDGDAKREVQEYHMLVHLFGGHIVTGLRKFLHWERPQMTTGIALLLKL